MAEFRVLPGPSPPPDSDRGQRFRVQATGQERATPPPRGHNHPPYPQESNQEMCQSQSSSLKRGMSLCAWRRGPGGPPAAEWRTR